MSLAASASDYDRLRALPLTVTAASWEALEMSTTSSWVRRTWKLQLSGGDRHGYGEDVSWTAAELQELTRLYPLPLLQHDTTFGSWSDALDAWEQSDEFKTAAKNRISDADYLRWAIESAGAELALRQSDTTLAELLHREFTEPAFGLSMGLGSPPSLSTIEAWRQHGNYRFKLDASSEWDEELLQQLAEFDCVDVVDLKAYYHGTPVDQEVDLALYERVARLLPKVVLEDLLPRADTMALAQSERERLAWDAPLHRVDDLRDIVPSEVGLASEDGRAITRYLNIKPSRFATWQRLLEAYAWGARHNICLYGGGQFELGIGREQIQALAAIFHPNGPNDIAPALFHQAQPQADLPCERIPTAMFSSTCFVARDTQR